MIVIVMLLVVGAGSALLTVVMARRMFSRARPSTPVLAHEPAKRWPAASVAPPFKRRLPGVAATDAYAVVPQRLPSAWNLVPPKVMDFSDAD
jgi:hypothetical protein